ncbi:hypothetical protein ACSTH7_25215, partial [Vibrio parahaemolyticus]
AIAPGMPELLIARGYAHLANGDFAKANEDAGRAAKLDAYSVQVPQLLLQAAMFKGDSAGVAQAVDRLARFGQPWAGFYAARALAA